MICWTPEAISRSLFNVANLTHAQTDYFLASHTPIRAIRDDRSGFTYTEETLFNSLFDPAQNEVLAIIHGEPGSGKSHLIRWLKLRAERAEAAGELQNFRSVLVHRVSGSLKEALEQMIEQLGEEFAGYLHPVKSALSAISETTARATLAMHLALELGPRRADRGLPRLDLELESLGDLFIQGTQAFFLVNGGVIDRNITLLNQASEIAQRQSPPEFVPKDFEVPERWLSNTKTSASVEALGYALLVQPELREQAARVCNEALPKALAAMTGLSGGVLQSVLGDIRRDLLRKGQQLAVFIEDVSVMSAIGLEVVNAFEPQTKEGQCRLISVLGMVDTGRTSYEALPANQRQRSTHLVSVGGDALREWRQDQTALAKFAARYLNVTRLHPADVTKLADQRRSGEDVAMSACEGCKEKEECHDSWGYVDLGAVKVGMFPFTVPAPALLLDQLKSSDLRTPRGLIMHVLKPVLSDAQSLPLHFPQENVVALSPKEPEWWTGFSSRFCGSWKESDQRRLRLLARAWVNADTAEQAAIELLPLLDPLGLPSFTSTPSVGPATTKDEVTPPPTKTPSPVSPKLQQILNDIAAWEREQGVPDAEVRGWLLALIRQGIPWEQDSEIPPIVWRKLDNKGTIEFEGGQTRTLTATYRIQIRRTAEAVKMLGALARYHIHKSWDFEDAEVHKRHVARWLRLVTPEIREQLKPRLGDREEPLRAAVRFLAVADAMANRRKLPDTAAELMARLLDPSMPDTQSCSNEALALSQEIRRIRPQIVDMVIADLDTPQGSGGCVYIDPVPILKCAITLDKYELPVFPESLPRSSPRYKPLDACRALPSLSEVLQKELESLDDLISATATAIECQAPGDPEALAQAVEHYCVALSSLRDVQKKVNMLVPHEQFTPLWTAGVYAQQRDVWGNALRAARDLVTSAQLEPVLFFNPAKVIEANRTLRVAEAYVLAVEEEYQQVRKGLTAEGDPKELAQQLTEHLTDIASIGGKE